MNNKKNSQNIKYAVKSTWSILAISLLLFLPSQPLCAQSVAEVWLNKAVTFLKKKGAEIVFRINEDGMRLGGKLLMEDNKYMFDTDKMKVWYDGSTQYTLQIDGDYSELYISAPTLEEQQSINPYLLLKHYNQNFIATDGGERNVEGKLVHKVILTAKDDMQELSSINVYILNTGELAALQLIFPDNRIYKIEVRSIRSGLTFTNSTFTYSEKEHPANEIIDMR